MQRAGLTDIACKVVMERDKSIAVADGTTEQHEGREREKWFWLPKSQVEVNDDGTVTMPEWLAKERGLI